MLEELREKLQGLTSARSVFDPSRFGDPIAMQTKWTPAKGGGASFQTHKLVEIDVNRMEFISTAGARIFYLLFFFMGLAIVIIAPLQQYSDGTFGIRSILPVLAGLIFLAAGGYMFYFGTTPIVFDKYKGYFWKNRKSPDEVSDISVLKHVTRLDNIHAIQLVSEYCSGDKSSYYSYELNLVLKDGSRINVVDHGNKAKLQVDAQVLSGFLGKPLWDAL